MYNTLHDNALQYIIDNSPKRAAPRKGTLNRRKRGERRKGGRREAVSTMHNGDGRLNH